MLLTLEEIEHIRGIFDRSSLQADPNRFIWKAESKDDEGFIVAIYESMGYRLKSKCASCTIHMLNEVRNLVGYPNVYQEIGTTLYKNRLDICKGCDSLNSIGTNCLECGCFVHVKAKFKKFHCPKKKW